MRILLSLLALTFAASQLPLLAQGTSRPAASPWERSIVHLEITRKQYDHTQPWTKRMRSAEKSGLVIGDRAILTTADAMFDRTLVRIQKGGRGKWWIGEVTWIDYHANLALVTTGDDDFWQGLEPARLDGTMPPDGALQIVRWREGKLESRKAEFSQFTVREGDLGGVPHVQLEVSSEIQATGAGEPVVANSHVVGMITGQGGNTCTAMPASFLNSILEARRAGSFRGLGYFHFYWQPAENPASLAYLKLEGEPRGVLVTDVPAKPGAPTTLKPRDILLQIDGFDIDIQGDYHDPEFGHLMLENLSTRNRWAGDSVPMKIWRDGAMLDITYTLPKADFQDALVPTAVYDQEPEFLIVGGLVFQPLTEEFLQSWGAEWKRRSPFRLFHYTNESASQERPALVFLSTVLPDVYNIGYQEAKYLVVDKVNGRRVSRLPELKEALQNPVDGFHVIHFVQGDSLRKLVLDAGDPEKKATQRVLKRYGIPRDHYFAPAGEKKPASPASPDR